MSHSENPRSPSEVRGRGTGERPFSSSTAFNTEGEEEGYVYKRGEEEIGTSPVPRPLFDPARALPYASDAKGKDTAVFDRTYVRPGEKPWHTLDREQVRYRATTVPAVLLNKGERQAAGRDAGLEWDEASRTYRPRRKASPPPQGVEGESKGFRPPNFRTGAGPECDFKHSNPSGIVR
jgi:hypothetical protein